MNDDLPDKLYSISDVSEILSVPAHVLRQWEQRFSDLKPRRLPSGKRAYTPRDMDILRRIKTMLKYEGLTSRGARMRLSQELYGGGHPRNAEEMSFLVDAMAEEARAIIRLFDPDPDASETDPEEDTGSQ